MTRLGASVLLGLGIAACDVITVTHLEFSTWGGAHIGLSITISGATVEYDCGEGHILQPIRPDGAGRFSVTGVHYPGVGGPIGVDRTKPRPARYDGRVQGDRMNLTVTLTDTNQALGTFELRGGASPNVVKCL